MRHFTLTETWIAQQVGSDIYQRGRQYYGQGAVKSLVKRGDRLQAEVEGSDIEPYRVEVSLPSDGEIEAECDCPYGEEFGGWCKHIVAVLLRYLHHPESAEEREPVGTLLSGLERDDLLTLMQKLVEREPRLVDFLEAQVTLLKRRATTADAPAATVEFLPVDTRTVRRGVRAALGSLSGMRYSDAYHHVGGVVSEVREFLKEARERVESGDGLSAMAILEAVTDEYKEAFEMLDDSDGEVSGLYSELCPLWTEAVLTAALSPGERKLWEKKLTAWDRHIRNYGVDEGFGAAILAVKQGWDDPSVVRALRGETPIEVNEVEDEEWDEDEEDEDYEDYEEESEDWDAEELTNARLNVLERQKRFEECLNLAGAQGLHDRYAVYLVKLKPVSEAVAYALQNVATVKGLFAVAQALREAGADTEALRVAEHGLSLPEETPWPAGYLDPGGKTALGRWLRDYALSLGQTDLAIRAVTTALKETPDLKEYEQLESLARDNWPALREELLTNLRKRKSYQPRGAVDIFLYEGLIDDALDAVANGYDRELLARVVEAAISTRPERAIALSKQQAESIMEGGKSEYYTLAARWLERARAAYITAHQEAEWRDYLADTLARHQRKYKLVPLLKALQIL